jgi:hypothetical protein
MDEDYVKFDLSDLMSMISESSEKVVSKRSLITPSAAPRPKRCEKADCKTKLTLTDSACKCCGFYCMKHRHAESHSCTFDYKGEGMNKLKAQLPEIRATKLENI